MEMRKVEAARGLHWFSEGLKLYGKNPGTWILMSTMFIAGMSVISLIRVVGSPLSSLLLPVIIAGFMLGCRDLLLGRKLVIGHLFAGFGERAPQLVAVGGINYIIQQLIIWIMRTTGGGELMDIVMGRLATNDPEVLAHAITDAGLSIMIGAALFSVLLMALQFAPALALFSRLSALESLKNSLRACLFNILPLSVYGAVLIALAIVGSVLASVIVGAAALLGLANAPEIGTVFLMILLSPLVFAATYLGYIDIFPPQPQTAALQPDSQNN